MPTSARGVRNGRRGNRTPTIYHQSFSIQQKFLTIVFLCCFLVLFRRTYIKLLCFFLRLAQYFYRIGNRIENMAL